MKFTFGPQLSRHMQVRGLTGKALAKDAGVTTGVITSCLHGQAVQVGSARKIAMALKKAPVLKVLDDLAAPGDKEKAPRIHVGAFGGAADEDSAT